jgi:hypothetical protein
LLDSLLDCSPRQSVTVITLSKGDDKHMTELSETLNQLPSLRRDQLIPIWTKHFPSQPAPSLRKELFVPLLSYRLQEQAYGGLSLGARKRLEAIAAGLPKGPRSRRQVVTPQKGTRILRQWRGDKHEVWCTDEGFFYQGERYGSLSKIAFVITGTKWSGPAFFGVKK